jgi:hypothetical protein
VLKCAINRVTSPNPVYSYSYTSQYCIYMFTYRMFHKLEAVEGLVYLENVKRETFAVYCVSSFGCSFCTQNETLRCYTLYTLNIKKLRRCCQCDMSAKGQYRCRFRINNFSHIATAAPKLTAPCSHMSNKMNINLNMYYSECTNFLR